MGSLNHGNENRDSPRLRQHCSHGGLGDNIVIVAGIPFGASGTTNLLRITSLPEASLCWHRAAAASADLQSGRLS
jgi:hypothetical protein